MPEPDIAKEIGLPDAEAADLVQKHSKYLASLTPAQYELVKHSTLSWKEAAAALGHGVTVQNLLDFVKSHGGAADINGALCVCIGKRPHH